ncbi:sigma-70 family RNA polymerase sigma factor [Chryseobacterium culicis]|jgi:RNA polymerase sigma-70 factor (ECF subfamily)|uniref:RNA polymerase sigma-70 factor, ECF subfamily n=1 Tax=Chryseobacterium culicis TaxID=680127 RepID=A0A1H6HI71_CHRCI|nr:sigma-70 family RNA polymerase sigma factor [Chryseobacterium culicis]MBE4948365.1 sigma-70 family RNA polymerase sigma factor [Chryseobacterium culicis]SEH33868.1 RNA polymerase sigma-70 factor, ECF subfamily [Chryseobacterium culicis]
MSSPEKEFLEKIEKHKGVVFKISKMYMDNKDDQNDLYQEIIYQAWKSYGDFQKRSDFSTWLYRTALNTAIVFLRSEKKRSFIQNQNVDRLNARQEPYNDTDDMNMKRMYEAIHQLSPIDKALIFFFLEGFSGKEIAVQLGITEVNTRVKLKRAKEKLKDIITRLEKDSN